MAYKYTLWAQKPVVLCSNQTVSFYPFCLFIHISVLSEPIFCIFSVLFFVLISHNAVMLKSGFNNFSSALS